MAAGESVTLEAYLDRWAGGDADRGAVAAAVRAISAAGVGIADLVARGPLEESLAKIRGVDPNAGGDAQKELDVVAEERIIAALMPTPVAFLASEESEELIPVNPAGRLVVAVDPLDGSSNIDTNVSVGTIYSILPYDAAAHASPKDAVMRPGRHQVAAGFLAYGPATILVATFGAGTHVFVQDRASGAFLLARENVEIPAETKEYGVNQSNVRHWDAPMKGYIEDCLAGKEGPRGKDFNMRWVGSMVADAFRIFTRGGVYLYPGDKRKGYAEGRLRLIYEANPVAFLTEQAKGGATDGRTRILDIAPHHIHQRIPLVFGSKAEVETIASYY
ncbi:class 1 fructose-bisphosphatase [Xanthobacter tagetidis]|uniref:Fructose-1,6-bisphosphatase class 1 n=1 Tax=Xanthobacter tagetidis TaxID=60216 RepID=A0A3L7AK45_9HYPH|nr:class 1 fructose-bisphosphatase [Xanthobacter tagetidis]RLP80637.1 class 1 fructose-bisphosphatase [Xanthobacter tagetidis]